ncbi:MAG: ComEC/Rec2 family competence protein [Patescibacteria group bacterium]|nr:ComEC/Rec2 family competence protein [Patescibacteria group bacterium]MDD4610531.1 ComEC/Rec2 family competence protein [Patescibacteria group bacterium]
MFFRRDIIFSKSKIFLFLCLFFIIGIVSASIVSENIIQNRFIWFSSLVAFFILTIFSWSNKKILLLGLWGCFLFFGVWRYSISIPKNYPDKIWHYNGQKIIVDGVVDKEPDVRSNNQKLEIKVRSVGTDNVETHDNASLPVSGKLLITADLFPEYNFGDKLEINCDLKQPDAINDFSYDRYLARYNIFSVCYYPQIKKIGDDIVTNKPADWFYKKIFILKNKIREIINFGLSDPESGLALGIMIGDRQGMGEELNQKFSQTGLTHIMAVSGMNMTIIAAASMTALLAVGLRRRQAFYLSLAFIIIFTILVGAPASAVRAAVMSFLAMLAIQLGRKSRLINALIFAAATMLLFNPRLLRDDVGFQLSFLALVGLIYVYPLWEKYLDKAKNKFFRLGAEIIALTLSAQVFTLPIIAYNFKQISLVAPLSNLLVLWTIAPAMLFIFLAMILGFLLPGLAFLFFLPANLLLKFVILAVDYTSRIPYAYIKVDYLWFGWVLIYYLFVIYLVNSNSPNKKSPK